MLTLASVLRPAVPLSVSAGLNLVYVVGAVALVRALGGRADRPASALVLAAPASPCCAVAPPIRRRARGNRSLPR